MSKRPGTDAPHVTVGEAADLLGFSPSTIQKLADDGSLDTLRTPGGHRRIARGSLENYRQRTGDTVSAPLGDAPGRPSVLLVDDDDIALTYLQHLISTHFPGFAVSTARDGMEAVVHLMQEKPSLVITDLAMPHDGFRLVHLLRDRPQFRDIRVVVVSALTPTQIAGKGGLPPDVAVFAKPLPVERFLGYMDAFVQNWRARAG